jgi:hypothetical protein
MPEIFSIVMIKRKVKIKQFSELNCKEKESYLCELGHQTSHDKLQ